MGASDHTGCAVRPPALDAALLEDALVGSPGRFTRELLAEVWGDEGAAPRVAKAFRGARWMNSRRRRTVRELLFGVVRGSAWLEAALQAGGWSGERRLDALWGRLLVASGLPAERVGEHFGEPVFAVDPVLPASRRARLALLGSLPEWFIDDLGDLDLAERFVTSLDDRAPLTLRCVAPVAEVLVALHEAGLQTRTCRWAPLGVEVLGRAVLQELEIYRQGGVEVQDEGSQLIAELVQPGPGDTVVDVCAGAGGKSLALLATSPAGVRVESLDVRESALKEARRRARRAGVSLSATCVSPSGPFPVAPAARVLVDAPCTGSGTLRRQPMLRWRLSEAWRDRQCALQRDILSRAAAIVRPDGRLIYATCSVSRAENQEQVHGFIDAHPEYSVVPISEPLGAPRAAELGGRFLQLESAVHRSDGFFAAVLQRSDAW